MQPYRTARPHAADECILCAPTGQGHQLCRGPGCEQIADTSVGRRHLTADAYGALPESLMPIDGVADETIYACDDCADGVEPFCVHAEPVPAPCPKCGAAGETACTGKDGARRPRGSHAARVAPPIPACEHRHRETCGVFTDCQCAADDPPPDRPKRPRAADRGPDTSGLTMPAPYAQMILHQAGHPWAGIQRAWNLLTQDNRPALAAEYYRTDDAGNRVYVNGQPILDTIVIPLGAGQPA